MSLVLLGCVSFDIEGLTEFRESLFFGKRSRWLTCRFHARNVSFLPFDNLGCVEVWRLALEFLYLVLG